MGDVTWTEILNILFRWFHVFAGILWVGLLYFFNFVNGSFMASLDSRTQKIVIPELMPRALFIFRWAAMITFIAGLGLLYINYLGPTRETDLTTVRGHWISLGILFGTIMWASVWFIIWPTQRLIIRHIQNGIPVPAEWTKRVARVSKLNTYLSVPLIFAMLAASSEFLHDNWYWFVGVLVIGFVLVHILYKSAPQIRTTV